MLLLHFNLTPCTAPRQSRCRGHAAAYAERNTGLVYGAVGYGAGRGLVVDDAANFQNVLSLPVGSPEGQVGTAAEAPLNAPLATTLGQAGFDVLADVAGGLGT